MNQQEELKQLRELVEKLQNENHKLRVQNENLTQAVFHAQKKIFGQSSESSRHIEGQLALFADGDPAKASGKRLVQSWLCGEPSDNGKLGGPDLRRVVDADL